MKEIFISSDFHFFHKNIITYCNRNYCIDEDSVLKMNEDILSEIDKLPSNCILINNGDVFLNRKVTPERLRLLIERMKYNNKELWLILGNHDRTITRTNNFFKQYKTAYNAFMDVGFDKVFPTPIVIDKFIFSHEPLYLSIGSNLINLYGHTHNMDISEDYFQGKKIELKNYYNVCWDKRYKILSLSDLRKRL